MPSFSSLKIEKSILILERKALIKFSIQNVVLRVGKKFPKCFPAGLLSFVFDEMFIEVL